MAITTRYSVAKTARSYDPDGVYAVNGSLVNSETQDMRDAYHYGTDVGGDVSDGPVLTSRISPWLLSSLDLYMPSLRWGLFSFLYLWLSKLQ